MGEEEDIWKRKVIKESVEKKDELKEGARIDWEVIGVERSKDIEIVEKRMIVEKDEWLALLIKFDKIKWNRSR